MSEAKFTKGPWCLKEEEVGVDYIRVRGTQIGGRYKVANVVCPKHWGNSEVFKREQEETRANAHLITAAPELHYEHEGWARLIGAVYVAVMQGDSEEAMQLIYDACAINFSTGEPVAESPALAKARGEVLDKT